MDRSNGFSIPQENKISPAPNQFSHKLKRREPYYFTGPMQGNPSEGEFIEGTSVLLVFCDEGPYCWVADENGIYAAIAFESLQKV